MHHVEPDAITLRGMRFHALVGVLPHEREHPQPVEVDLTVWVHPEKAIVDYRELYAAVTSAMDAKTLRYLEEIAESIAKGVLAHARVERARVTIRKPHVAIGGPLDFAEISILRKRDA